jgi:hypothetical protein
LLSVQHKIDGGVLSAKFLLEKCTERQIVLGDKNTHDSS